MHSMDWPLIEHIRDLQNEIGLIEEASRAYLASGKRTAQKALLQQRRIEREAA